MLKKLASHTIIYGLSPYVPRLLGFFVLPIITKDLTSVDYGIYGIILAYVGSIEVLRDLGLKMVLFNSFTKMPSQFKWLWRSIYGFLFIWNWVYAILAGVLLYFIVPSQATENRVWIIVLNMAPIVLFGPAQLLGRVFYQMKEKPVAIAWRTVLFGLLSVILNLWLISGLKLGYMGWFYSSCIVGILTNFSFWYGINFTYKFSPIFNFKWRLIKNSLLVSLPTVPHYYASYIIQTSDKAIMSALNTPTQDIGLYNFASSFGNLFGQLAMALGQAARPQFNSFFRNQEYYKIRKLVFTMQTLFLGFTFIVCVWLKEIFSLLVNNKELAASYDIALFLIMSINYRPMYYGSANFFIYNERTKKLLSITAVASLISVFLNFALIPLIGTWAAVLSVYVSFMYMGYSGYFLKDFRELKVNFYPVAWLLLTLFMTLLAYVCVSVDWHYKLIGTSFLFVIALVVLMRKKNRIYWA